MKAIVSETTKACPQFYDLDPMNIVWHGNYPRFFEVARTALLERIGYSYDAMVQSGYAWPIVDMHIRYYRPLRLGRWVDVTASITEWENRLKIEYVMRDSESGQKTTKGHTVQVAVDVKSEAMLWQTPPILKEKLAPFL
ncbi:MAG TPA: acyl-CoA thioesterase [Rhizomicrobium sp.]|nr:acyl-CoA thioesterase [Rhizomicrobium sp.]